MGRRILSASRMPVPTQGRATNVLPLEGFEPSIPYGQRILSASRIPVPTQGRGMKVYFTPFVWFVAWRQLSLQAASGSINVLCRLNRRPVSGSAQTVPTNSEGRA